MELLLPAAAVAAAAAVRGSLGARCKACVSTPFVTMVLFSAFKLQVDAGGERALSLRGGVASGVFDACICCACVCACVCALPLTLLEGVTAARPVGAEDPNELRVLEDFAAAIEDVEERVVEDAVASELLRRALFDLALDAAVSEQ